MREARACPPPGCQHTRPFLAHATEGERWALLYVGTAHLRVELEGVQYGLITAVREVTLTVDRGDTVAVLGLNGAGKTSLLRAIVGAVSTRRRCVWMNDTDLTRLSTDQLARAGVVYVPDGGRCFPHLTVEQNLILSLHGVRDVQPELRHIWSIFPQLADLRARTAGLMSGGERQMLAVARGLLLHPKVLLIDEPSSGLAPIVVSRLYAAIAKLKDEGISLILAEQSVRMILGISDKVIVMQAGAIAYHGPAQDVSASMLEETYLGGKVGV